MYDQTLEVTIPAKLLYELNALAGGYTMSHGGRFISSSVRDEAYWILYEAGYEYWQDETLF